MVMKMSAIVVFLLLLLNLLVFAKGVRILSICAFPSYSHQSIHTIITKELSLRGHQVVQFTLHPLKNESLTNLTEIDISFLYKYTIDKDYENSYNYYRFRILHLTELGLKRIAEDVLEMREMQGILNNPIEKFDLVLLEVGANPVFLLLGNKFGCPVIGVRSVALKIEMHDALANPTNPSYISIGHYENVDSVFWKKIDNLLFGILYRVYHHFWTLPMAKELAKKYFPTVTITPLEAEKNTSLILVNTNPILMGARPLVPSIVEIGGIHLKQESNKKMSPDLKSILDKSKKGVVFVSLGTTINGTRINQRFVDVLNHTFRNIPFDVVWKWDGPSENLSKNVKIFKWMPQTEVLAHPNTKLFITHAGYMSFTETVHFAIPVLAVPLFSDQYLNAQRMEKLGIGLRADYVTVTKEEFLEKVSKVVETNWYKENILKISNLVKDKPMNPLEEAIWWIEYVLRHKGTPYIRSEAVNLSWIQYLLLDVFLFAIMAFVLVLIIVKNVLRFLVCKTTKRNVIDIKKTD